MHASTEATRSQTGAPVLAVDSLIAGYQGVRALHGVSLTVGESEIVAVLGANGAGKTTLLRAISALIAAESGSIRLHGTDISRQTPEAIVRAGAVHVPQGRMVFSALTVRENLMLGGFTRPASDAAAGIERAVSYFPRLGERMSQRAGTLSGGEQQMLAIARGLMSRPTLLMLDEPSMGVAPVIKDAIFDQLGEISRNERTAILLVEQDADYALGVSRRAYVLETGRIVLSGAADQLAEDDQLKRAYLGG